MTDTTYILEVTGDSEKIDAVSIAVPTKYHAQVAQVMLDRRIACLIEKPLASTVDEAQQLVDIAAACDTIVQVGHTERFNPAVRAVAAMDLTPRFMEVNRISPMTFRSLDIGVVMDMMIHDLDIVLSLAQSEIAKVDATGVPVLGQHEDVVNARIVFESGCVANLTASRLALKTERKMRFFSESAYVSLDYQSRNGMAIHKNDNEDALKDVRKQLDEGGDLSDLDYSDLVRMDQLSMDGAGENDPLTAELESFLDAVKHSTTPVVDVQAGVAAIEAAQRVLQAIATHQWEGVSGTMM